ncbi:hypothetical protein A2G96_12045 [Cupriavidus nantongensis]|uniref:Uncharacterized protein n=1 Tax=Cupriavidus nantongensis TaxID=1796606 RepID=A0A142JJZ5_9BURK|nr:hypothetical protein A2G96_12045 [Cupriavidus nantongensis]
MCILDVVERLIDLKMSMFLEVEGAAHYLPAYAGNLDAMTSAALRTAETPAKAAGTHRFERRYMKTLYISWAKPHYD